MPRNTQRFKNGRGLRLDHHKPLAVACAGGAIAAEINQSSRVSQRRFAAQGSVARALVGCQPKHREDTAVSQGANSYLKAHMNLTPTQEGLYGGGILYLQGVVMPVMGTSGCVDVVVKSMRCIGVICIWTWPIRFTSFPWRSPRAAENNRARCIPNW